MFILEKQIVCDENGISAVKITFLPFKSHFCCKNHIFAVKIIFLSQKM